MSNRVQSIWHWLDDVLAPIAMPAGEQPFDCGLNAIAERISADQNVHLFGWYAASSLAGPRPAAGLLHGLQDTVVPVIDARRI